jgi:hypothetical protein
MSAERTAVEVATVFLFRDCFASSFWSPPIVLSWYGSGLRSSRRLVFALKSTADSALCLIALFCGSRSRSSSELLWFIGWGPPRRQAEHHAVYSSKKRELRRGLSPAGSWGSLYFRRPVNVLVRGGNNRCATQFGYVQDFRSQNVVFDRSVTVLRI